MNLQIPDQVVLNTESVVPAKSLKNAILGMDEFEGALVIDKNAKLSFERNFSEVVKGFTVSGKSNCKNDVKFRTFTKINKLLTTQKELSVNVIDSMPIYYRYWPLKNWAKRFIKYENLYIDVSSVNGKKTVSFELELVGDMKNCSVILDDIVLQ